MQASVRPRKDADLVLRPDDLVCFHKSSGVIVHLNRVGYIALLLADGTLTIKAIAEFIASKMEIPDLSSVISDLLEFFAMLNESGFVGIEK